MAIYHCQAKAISRAAGRSATAAAAYRAGEIIKDERTGEIHDYSRKKGVEFAEIVTPDGSITDRATLWNAAENAERRKDAKVAREWEIALPSELTATERASLVREFARELTVRYKVAADICIHMPPGKGGDERNYHAHILTTTRTFSGGRIGGKTRILDSPMTSGKEIAAIRQIWADMANRALERSGHDARIDHRSLAAQGVERAPTIHLGPAVTAMERRGIKTERGDLNRAQRDAHQTERQELAALERLHAGIARLKGQSRAWHDEQARLAAEKARQAELERQEQERQRQAELARKREEWLRRLEAERREREEERRRNPRRGRGR